MSELILDATEDSCSRIKGEALEVMAVVKDSLTTQWAKRRVEKGLCVLAAARAAVSLAVGAYRRQWV